MVRSSRKFLGMTEPKDILERPTCTVPEAAAVLGISRDSAYRAAERGDIPSIRIGKRVVVPTARLRKLLGLDTPAQSSPGDQAAPGGHRG